MKQLPRDGKPPCSCPMHRLRYTVTTMERIAEPELMEEPQQVAAYAAADFSAAHQQLIHHIQIFWQGPDPSTVIDLGTGTGDIAIRLARTFPSCHVTAVDAGAGMLRRAAQLIDQAGLGARIGLVERRLPDIAGLPRFPLLVSNSLLHHLPDPMTLWRVLSQLACPGALVVIMDLHRPSDKGMVERLVAQHAADAPPVLQADFRASLHAAYTCDEVMDQLHEAALPLAVHAVGDRHWIAWGRLNLHAD